MTSITTRKQICSAKIRYETAAMAHAVVVQMSRRAKRFGRMGVYQCSVCGGFHMTTHKNVGKEMTKP